MTKYFFLVGLGCFLAMGWACKQKSLSKTDPSPSQTLLAQTIPKTDTTKTILVNPVRFDFTYLISKARINFQQGNESESGLVQIRMRKDSLIWFNVTKVGIEGLRGLITRDSLFIWDRINSSYSKLSFDSLSRQLHIPLHFGFLQAILLGNIPFEKTEGEKTFRQNPYFLLRQTLPSLQVDNLLDTTSLRPLQVLVSHIGTGNKLELAYSQFIGIGPSLFPSRQQITLKYLSQPTLFIELEHQKTELSKEALKFPFNAPKFERKGDNKLKKE
jgi:hypothetical protein